jgi:hypothetical protein
MYKLFARLLYNRISIGLLSQQSPDQAGFRPGYCTDDNMFTVMQILEKANEWQVPVWIASIDFQKAFDTVEHQSLWNALRRQGVSDSYVNILARLYSGQTAAVRTDKISRSFLLERGTKQGDPLSSLIFNAVLEDIVRKSKQTWSTKKVGIQIGATCDCCLTNLRFADDVLLFAHTLPQLQNMLSIFATTAASCGLLLHPDKTKILANAVHGRGRPRRKHASVNDMEIEIIPFASSLKYLGRLVGFDKPHHDELEHRIRQAWKAFMAHKSELTCKAYSLRDRLRLFDSIVGPTVLYGSASWCLTKESQVLLQRTQRKMLRMILGSPRRRIVRHDGDAGDRDSEDDGGTSCETDVGDDLEPWQDWLARTTRAAEAQLQKYKLETWATAWRRRVWRWAARIATYHHDRWAWKAARWEPELSPLAKGRQPHRQRKRWSDDIVKFLVSKDIPACTTSWIQHATDEVLWKSLEEEFCCRNGPSD